jgi:hypothetical protein
VELLVLVSEQVAVVLVVFVQMLWDKHLVAELQPKHH